MVLIYRYIYYTQWWFFFTPSLNCHGWLGIQKHTKSFFPFSPLAAFKKIFLQLSLPVATFFTWMFGFDTETESYISTVGIDFLVSSQKLHFILQLNLPIAIFLPLCLVFTQRRNLPPWGRVPIYQHSGYWFFCFSPEAAFYYSYLPVCTDMTYTVDWVLKTNDYPHLPVPCQLFALLLCLVTMQGHVVWLPCRDMLFGYHAGHVFCFGSKACKVYCPNTSLPGNVSCGVQQFFYFF